MSILTKEVIQKILNDDWLLMDDCEGLENCTVIKELARMALAAMDSEPVAWLLSGGGAKNVVCFDSGNAYADPLREVTPLYRHAQPAPVVPGKWISVSERMPEVGDIVLTAMGGVVNVGETECSAANCRFFTSVISGRELLATHWMQLPAAPQEVGDA
ncbi:DUF551 domain-containing protein [Klebsiella michiganensis]|uniref:DUF551 domain-containing protein n=1 Tax=Klebsiella michiganensis TaxID=1134687 RepID=UPI000C7D32FD|nr:DUF551 domain-containing protein [Klebsiella michiganensis]